MPDRYPPDSVLVPQWTRVVDGLPPENEQKVTFVVTCHDGHRRVEHGRFLVLDHDWGFFTWSARFMGREQHDDRFGRTVTHWSPRVGIPLPEDK